MSIELHAGNEAAHDLERLAAVLGTGPSDRSRPNVSGDLPTVLQCGPMFRRAVAGYDRFQVDTYVRWAEDELATADREREHLLARHVDTRAALEEARRLLAHSAGGGELLQVSGRIGSMLAAAADEAESIRAEAENHRSVARAQAEVIAADARRVLADAETEAARMLAEAADETEEMAAEAARVVARAERTVRDARAEAAARLEEVRALEQRAVERAEQIRQRAVAEALAARLHARDEVVRMLTTGREERRRADEEATASRERLDRDVAARRAALLAEVEELERRRASLRAELDDVAEPDPASSGVPRLPARAYLGWIQDRLGRHPAPGPAAAGPSVRVATRNGERTAA
jgi:cell division septum initiation protein DivIVA